MGSSRQIEVCVWGEEGHYRWENWPEQRPRLVEKVVGLEEVRKAVATQCETDWTSSAS